MDPLYQAYEALVDYGILSLDEAQNSYQLRTQEGFEALLFNTRTLAINLANVLTKAQDLQWEAVWSKLHNGWIVQSVRGLTL